jgi:hypothetical protein
MGLRLSLCFVSEYSTLGGTAADFSANDFIAFQVAHMLRKHFLGHAGNQLAKLSEALDAAFEIKYNPSSCRP